MALFATLVGSPIGGTVAANAPANMAVAGSDGKIRVSVPYVTNRRLEKGGSDPDAYGGERGPPSVGRCEIVFTPIPLINEIAHQVPFYVAGETSELRTERQADTAAFWDQLSDEAKATTSGSVVAFIHGYNYDFERHCEAAAELQRTLVGKATVLMLSWPSNGRPTDYIPDQADVEWSVPFLARVLGDLGDRLGADKVMVLAHSLGSRGLVFTLERLSAEHPRRPLIGRLVLMAPDFDAQTFVERLPALLPLTGDMTLYASSNDVPLKASRQLHASSRLGEAGHFLTVAPGMQTVDVSPVGRYQMMGHEYFRFHPKVAADLAALLGEGRSAPERTGLRPVPFNGLEYWELTGDTARSDANRQGD